MSKPPSVEPPRPPCRKCGKVNPNTRAVCPLVPGSYPKEFSKAWEFWCGLCRFNHMGKWKFHKQQER